MAESAVTLDKVFGAAIRLHHCMKTGGEELAGELSDVIDTYRNTFTSIEMGKVSFALGEKSAPARPPSKPASRHAKSRMIGMREAQIAAIKGNLKKKPTCSSCRFENCMASNCKVMASWGVLITDGTKRCQQNGIANLVQGLQLLMNPANADNLTDWPADNVQCLTEGVPTHARHIKIHGLHVMSIPACPRSVVAAITFIPDGGSAPLRGYEYVPMTNDELVKAIHVVFGAKTFFISPDFAKTMTPGVTLPQIDYNNADSMAGSGGGTCNADSDGDGDIVLADFVQEKAKSCKVSKQTEQKKSGKVEKKRKETNDSTKNKVV
jgi:hypothetical protein